MKFEENMQIMQDHLKGLMNMTNKTCRKVEEATGIGRMTISNIASKKKKNN